MAREVDFDMEAILQFWRELQEFSVATEDIVQRMNDALSIVRETWQDEKIDKPSAAVLEANERMMRMVRDLCPLLEDFLRRQNQWADDYTSI
ncbi:MAG: hypothetical protein J6X49_17980 [Victivallales bacterium]|nr:hypothetical protein [Victivallales bacterium]